MSTEGSNPFAPSQEQVAAPKVELPLAPAAESETAPQVSVASASKVDEALLQQAFGTFGLRYVPISDLASMPIENLSAYLETLTKVGRGLSEDKVRIDTNLENKRHQLEQLRAQAQQEFGVSSLEELEALRTHSLNGLKSLIEQQQ